MQQYQKKKKYPKRRKTSVKIEYLTETICSSLQKNSIVAADTKGSANVSVFPKDQLQNKSYKLREKRKQIKRQMNKKENNRDSDHKYDGKHLGIKVLSELF